MAPLAEHPVDSLGRSPTISDDRTFYDVKGLYLKSSSRPYVNKKGVVCFNIHKVDLRDLEIKEGDEFVITAEDGRIILTVI